MCIDWYVSEEILGLISGSLPDDQRGFTCMHLQNVLKLDFFKEKKIGQEYP